MVILRRSLYPVQIYLYIKTNGVEGLTPGIYYYDSVQHQLVLLDANSTIDSRLYGGNQPIFAQSAFSVFLIAKLNAIAPIYGELAQDFCLLEAGHIGQLLMDRAPTYQIGLCPIGYLELTKLKDLFQLESNQILLYSLIGGKIDTAWTKQWLSSKINQRSLSSSTQLQEYLKQKLPAYMIPSEYIFLDALPLTPNGKIDRQALPTPKIGVSTSAEVFTLPTNDIEKALANIIQQLLQIESVDIHNNFFDLGMDSLKLVQFKNQLLSGLEVNISIQQLLIETNNIAKLALAIDEQLTLAKIKINPSLNQPDENQEIFKI